MRLLVLVAVALIACLAALSGPLSADEPTGQSGKTDTRVSPLLRRFIEDRESSAAQSGAESTGDLETRSQAADGVLARVALASQEPRPEAAAAVDPVRFDGSGNVQVYIHLENTDDATLQELRDQRARIEIINSDWNVVQAWVPISALDRIGSLDAVQRIEPPDYGVTKTGRVNTQGDAGHRADMARAFTGLTGAGVKVGAISDGVDSLSSSQGSGDLPSSVEIDPDRSGSGHEGTAILEIIHDLAPGARLAFSGPSGSLAFAESVLWLANDAFDGEGADIIVDDVGYYLQPYFEDGYVAQAAADAVAGGAVFVSAAGNFAKFHYEATFSDGSNGYHDFDSSSETDIALRVKGNGSTFVVLQWNDPFGGSNNDYDLFVCPPGIKPLKFNLQNEVCDSSTYIQNGDDNPLEFASFSGSNEADIYIRKYSGSAKTLELFANGGVIQEHDVLDGGIVGHPAVSGVLAVGAIDVDDPGQDDPESFSDRGPSVLISETRNKPDVMGFDGISTTGPGGRFNPFFGTSAAAPHVAGIAALVMEAQRRATPDATKKTVADAVTRKLRDSAIDLGESGHDNSTGYGRADAFSAIQSIASDSTNVDLAPSSGFAATHTVNSTGDGADDDTTDGVCDDGTVDGSTNCTLRAAIQQANAGTGAIIKFNISGSGVQTISLASSLPTITDPVFIDGYSQTGASAGTVLVELDGTSAGDDANGLTISGKGSHVRGLAVINFDGNGIALQGGQGEQILSGNLIGTDSLDASDHGNGKAGVYVNGAPGVVLWENVISGNASHGVFIEGSASKPRVYQNKIGTNAAGTSDVGNTKAGVHLASRVNNARIRDNVISGNDSHGVSVAGASDTFVEHNRVGTNQASDADLGNTGSGIHVSGARRTTVAGNVIAGNDSHGISLTGSGTGDTDITENHIGANPSGTALGNTGSGIHIGGGSHTNSIEENTIANNGGDGVMVVSNGSTKNSIRRNAIHDNTGDGIDLGGNGATTNDSGDSDSGPNNLQNYPTSITFAARGDVATVTFTLDVTSGRTYHIDFYSCDSNTSGEGKELLGSTLLRSASSTGQDSFIATSFKDQISRIKAPSGTHITATATQATSTRSTGSTSEFAPCVAHVALPGLDISKDYVDVTEGSTATYTVALSSAPSADTDVLMYPLNTGVATVSTSVSPVNKLTFTSTNYSQPQTVTVSGVSDDDGYNEATEISHRVRIGGEEYPTARLPVEVDDDDPPLLNLVSTTSGVTFPVAATIAVGNSFDGAFTIDEGSNATYTIALASEPAGDTTITLESSFEASLTVSPASITFTKTGEATESNEYQWDAPQTVTATAVTDNDAFNEAEEIFHDVTVSGKTYTTAVVRVNVNDSSLPWLTFTPSSREVSVDEGSTATYSIALASDPGDGKTATLAIRPTHLSVGDPITVSPNELTFTGGSSGNWETAQDVTVTGLTDDDEFDNIAEIEHRITVGTRFGYRPDVNVTVSDGNRAPYFEEGILTFRSVPENSAASTEVGDPVTALDLNTGDTLTYSLEDDPSNEFEINSSTGQITVAAGATLDHEARPPVVRLVKVTVSDRTTNGLTDSIAVDIMVTDVNEPAEITGEASPLVNENTSASTRVARYTATDPEQDSITWSVEDTASNPSEDFEIDASGNLRFKSPPDHETEDEYSIVIVATDDGDPVQSGELPVTVTVTDVNEPPVVTGESTIDNYAENGTGSVATYSASDPERDTDIAWSLGGPDRGDFTITGGVLAFVNSPDYDRPADSGGNNQYEVTIYATDSTNKRGQLHVDVIVQDVNEPPEITGPDTIADFPENSATSRQVGRYTASDPEGATVTLSLTGPDGNEFNLASNGALTFRESPDYEEGSSYTVTVMAKVGTGASDSTNSATRTVTVNIRNVEERGAVTLSVVQPQENTPSLATLEDGDNPTGTTWQWHRTSSRGSTGTAIANADSDTYTPIGDDVGFYLRAVATYDDPHGTGKTAVGVSANRVLAVNPDNVRPEFPGSTAERSVRENSRAGSSLGAPVRATDANSGDLLTYSIPASDLFEISQSTGQLRTRLALDHEYQASHTITVTAADPGNLRATVDVTITVEDVDERPVISGPNAPEVAENGGTSVATYTATDPDDTGIDWVLTGSDSDALTLSGGILTLNSVPDFEETNSYRVTVEVRERSPGTSVDRPNVTVRVTNVDEPGIVEIDVSEPRVGQRLSPTVEDPDGGVGSIEWKWERRVSGGAWTPIPRATSRSYTPTRDDNGYDLRVIAIYLDREGSGKTETHEFTSAVVLRPYFDAETAERTIQENSPEARDLGGSFTARHPDNVNLTYTLGGSGSIYFTIDPATGHLKTGNIPLDYETLSDHEAEVGITATAPDSETATIAVTVSVTDECRTAGEPPCAPGRPGVSSASDTSLRVTWSTPRTPSGTSITGYDLQYRESGGNGTWIPESVSGAGRSHVIDNLTKGTAYEVQIRAGNFNGTGDWSQSGRGTPGVAQASPQIQPQPQPQPQPEPQQPASSGGSGGGGFGGGGFGGFGGFIPPAPPATPRPVSSFQPVARLFQPLSSAGTLGRVWRLVESSQRWRFYDPRPELAPFNTLRTINVASDPPAVAIMSVTRNQRFRGMPLYPGWNFVPLTAQPLAAGPASGIRSVEQLVRPLVDGDVLQRVWWLNSRTQEWQFHDPDPRFAPFNTLSTVNLAANPPVVLVISVDRRTEFRGRTLYRGWNYVVMR